jgi:hypothetical protein
MTGGTANDVIHYHIVDKVLHLEPWLDDMTACSFPSPWSLTLPSPQRNPWQGAAQRFLIRGRSAHSERRAVEAHKREQRRRHLAHMAIHEYHSKYTGRYGHLLFGNITVLLDEESSGLKIQFGQIGMGRMHYQSESLWLVEFEGPLAFLSEEGSPKTKSPLLYFMVNRDGRFHQIKALGYEAKAPPIFHRDLAWTDPLPSDLSIGSFSWP